MTEDCLRDRRVLVVEDEYMLARDLWIVQRRPLHKRPGNSPRCNLRVLVMWHFTAYSDSVQN